ncbi:uncharacterized protein RHIMIDRAFT_92112 [Rhizopus microsporus ATCC 52813]|uniref:Uncharacterized protein n=1 Tax=Rhizopus microsporus ATCC 52813 TaxID=1340429 RepID=A0A2G4T3V7_RHIZD|nr:uncharacterized protein RHIMIDRAFT_92112 [Rhizopus microsporus ATCC 52813]PHZ15701.1 hypothetical protein RHIMIDRAFT_92112 [Rhizopus microsporus ATCC 52813]
MLSFATKGGNPTTLKAGRPDTIIICCCEVEVSCGEAKPPRKGMALIDKGRARIAELCMRQLHARLKHATSTSEQSTFGVLIARISLGLTKLQFNNSNYLYFVLKSIKIPRRKEWYRDVEVCLGACFSFKISATVCIISFNSLLSNGYKPLLSNRLERRMMAASYPYMINALGC